MHQGHVAGVEKW